AATIAAMFASEGEARAQARAFLWFTAGASLFALGAYFVPFLEQPPVGFLGLAAIAQWTFLPYVSPMLLGVGGLVGPRVAASLLLGAISSWGLLGPLASRM